MLFCIDEGVNIFFGKSCFESEFIRVLFLIDIDIITNSMIS